MSTALYSLTRIRECKQVVVCGAGIGGLTLAIKLAQMGYRPSVLEVRSEASVGKEGVFLTLAPNGMNGLRAIGCYEAVKDDGINTLGIEIQNARGRRLGLADQSDFEKTFGAPSVTLQRGRLADILVARARAAGVDLQFGTRVTGIEHVENGVRIQMSQGACLDADILVGADGLRSTVRQLVFPEYPTPHFTGLIGTGGMVESTIPDTNGVMRMTFGNNAFFGYLKAPGQPVYWFNSFAGPECAGGNAGDPSALARTVFSLHAEDPSPNAEILRRVETIPRSYPVYDMPELPCWWRGSVVLIGDAAHAVGPHAGQGASMAIEDALVLAACLDAQERPATAFGHYEALRRSRVKEVVKLTARNSSQKRTTSRLGILIRDMILPFLIPIGIRAGRRLFRYRADEAPLLDPNLRRSRLASLIRTGRLRLSRDSRQHSGSFPFHT